MRHTKQSGKFVSQGSEEKNQAQRRLRHSPLLHESPESSIHLVEESDEGLLVVLLLLTWVLELHVCDLLDNFLLPLELRHRLLRSLMETNDDPHHADGLGERTHVVVLGESVLLQEILAD